MRSAGNSHYLLSIVLLALSAFASAAAEPTGQPGNSKLGIFDLGRDDGRTVRLLINTVYC